MIVVVTAGAEADLEQIVTYVAEQSPKSALKLVRDLREMRVIGGCPARLHVSATLRAFGHPQAALRTISDFLPRRSGYDRSDPYPSRRPRL